MHLADDHKAVLLPLKVNAREAPMKMPTRPALTLPFTKAASGSRYPLASLQVEASIATPERAVAIVLENVDERGRSTGWRHGLLSLSVRVLFLVFYFTSFLHFAAEEKSRR